MPDSLQPHGLQPPGPSEIFQARVPILSSRGSSQPRDQTQVSCTAGRFSTNWATREAWNWDDSLENRVTDTRQEAVFPSRYKWLSYPYLLFLTQSTLWIRNKTLKTNKKSKSVPVLSFSFSTLTSPSGPWRMVISSRGKLSFFLNDCLTFALSD